MLIPVSSGASGLHRAPCSLPANPKCPNGARELGACVLASPEVCVGSGGCSPLHAGTRHRLLTAFVCRRGLYPLPGSTGVAWFFLCNPGDGKSLPWTVICIRLPSGCCSCTVRGKEGDKLLLGSSAFPLVSPPHTGQEPVTSASVSTRKRQRLFPSSPRTVDFFWIVFSGSFQAFLSCSVLLSWTINSQCSYLYHVLI